VGGDGWMVGYQAAFTCLRLACDRFLGKLQGLDGMWFGGIGLVNGWLDEWIGDWGDHWKRRFEFI